MRTLAGAVLLAGVLVAPLLHAADVTKGRSLSEKGVEGPPCASCHGLDGAKPTAAENPILAGQHYDYLLKSLKEYKSTRRSNPVMQGIAAKLSTKDMEDLAAWFASQKSPLRYQR